MVASEMETHAHHARANHTSVFRDSGLNVKQYRYYDKKNISLDLDGMVQDINVNPS